ncbi:hypothetical protein BU17DRAFT_100186 [Hysterangium stoloniferum]|nr:hypothetical protein BU17DRAFT_100186 [Hysterangium stoloniferum]
MFSGVFSHPATIAGGILGITYAVVKAKPPLIPAASSAVNSGIVGLTFFSLREYVASPLLVHAVPWPSYIRRKEMLQADNKSSPSRTLSYSEMRSHSMLDTALAGSMTGGILNVWRRGPSGIIPGIVTATLICSALQFTWNEANVIRVKYISRPKGTTLPSGADAPSPAPERSFSQVILEGLGVILPIKRIPDDVYLEKLHQEKQVVEKRLEVVRQELRVAEAVLQEENNKS